MLTPISLTAGVIYYIISIRNNQRNQELALKSQEQTLETRQAQLFWGINQFSYSSDWFDSLSKVLEMNMKNADDYDRMMKDPESLKAFQMIGGYLEGIGVLVREGLVDVRLVSLLSSGVIVWWWDRFGSFVLETRKYRGFPRYMIETEYLAKRVSDYGREHPEMGIASANIPPT